MLSADHLPAAVRAEREPSMLAARGLTALIVVGPVVALGIAVPMLWGQLLQWRDLVIGVTMYVVAGHGIAIGYHRLFSHRSFRANRALKIGLAVAGALAVEGSLIGWVAAHRRHHRFSDRRGDPHSPHAYGPGLGSSFRGLIHAHVGWLFEPDALARTRYVPDLLADPDLVLISALWPYFAVGSLLLPFALGWALSGTLTGAMTTFVWAGIVRMVLLHHVTWSINSVCHMFGRRPFRTKDHSTNVAVLSVLSMGESFHNFHHAYPASARHGVLKREPDSSAVFIGLFQRLGWATDVHWPEPQRIAALRRTGLLRMA